MVACSLIFNLSTVEAKEGRKVSYSSKSKASSKNKKHKKSKNKKKSSKNKKSTKSSKTQEGKKQEALLKPKPEECIEYIEGEDGSIFCYHMPK